MKRYNCFKSKLNLTITAHIFHGSLFENQIINIMLICDKYFLNNSLP